MADIELGWPSELDDELSIGVHRVLHDVVTSGGAVGYLSPPDRAASDKWLADLLDSVRAGDAALALARVDGQVAAFGCWRRNPWEALAHSAEIQKVMAHPDARGLGLGRLVVGGLIDNARGTDLEILLLGARGNNHGVIELYEDFGFQVHGRAPNVVEVGNLRFDSVEMHLVLGRAPEVILRGSLPGGPGSSPSRQS
ncbi:MAG TPA: GNAT family N-acetyltransferase [Pseudonocardiaceae bacterium]|nr:GNAT family N-acetyltransferase [Pseudonocardiaceae bacterium]